MRTSCSFPHENVTELLTALYEQKSVSKAALSIQGEKAVWAHIGDSRLYLFSDGTVAPLTKDHSVTYRKYLGGEITYMDISLGTATFWNSPKPVVIP